MEELNEKIAGLVKKAEKSGMPYSILKKVYDRGMAAWKTGHRPGTTPQQWAFARVNSFVTKSSGTWGKADKDLADKVRGAKKESIENPKKAKDLIGQVREKLGKDADAGDYIKDFRKSDAPQFKGKSDKKIRDMAIAAYLDDKDKKESIKENLLIHTKDDRVTDQLVYHLRDLQGRGRSNISDIDTDNVYMHRQNKYVKGRINVEIDGSRSDSQKLIKDLQKKYGSKIKVSLDMGEDNLQEQFVFVFRYEYKGKRYAAPFKSEKDAKSSMKAAMKDKNVKNPSITKDILKRGVKFAEDVEIVEFIDEAVLAGRDYKYDGIGPIKISKKMYAKVQRDSKGKDFSGKPYMMALNPKTQETELVPVKFEEVDLDERLKFKYALIDTSKNNEVIALSSDDKELKSRVHYKNRGRSKVVKLKRPVANDKMIGYPLKEEVDIQESGHQDVPSMKTQVQIAMDALQKMNTELGKLSDEDELPTWWTNKVATAVNKLDGMADYIDAMHDRGQKMNESNLTEEEKKCPRCGAMNETPFDKCHNCGLPHDEFATYKAEEVDNSLMAQATRVISKTSIKEKIDPADIDIRATDADRKAADKNIIIQLRRAQDMVKQTGRQDQTGIEFLDRKKQKVDSKIINKALDMFDKMTPNDKAKMHKTIGQSYRDLLKTVQRGRV